MSDLTAEVRAALAKATPGPWRSVVKAPCITGVAGTQAGADWEVCWTGDEMTRYSSEDAHLIASAPSWLAALCDRLDAAEAKLTAVRELHQRVGIYEDADHCNCLEKTTHNVGYTEDGDELCLDSPCPDEGYRCAECVDEWGEPVPYPCPTIIALNGDSDE